MMTTVHPTRWQRNRASGEAWGSMPGAARTRYVYQVEVISKI